MGDNGVYTFSKGISLKANIIYWLKLKLAYVEAGDKQFTHYAASTPKNIFSTTL